MDIREMKLEGFMAAAKGLTNLSMIMIGWR